MPDRHRREVAVKPIELLVERGPLDLPAVDRVGPVEHEDRNLALRRLLQHVAVVVV